MARHFAAGLPKMAAILTLFGPKLASIGGLQSHYRNTPAMRTASTARPLSQEFQRALRIVDGDFPGIKARKDPGDVIEMPLVQFAQVSAEVLPIA